MIKEILSLFFVFSEYRFKKPVDDAVRKCWKCAQYFLPYPDNPHLVCPNCNDFINNNQFFR